jgi:hypothetical protein
MALEADARFRSMSVIIPTSFWFFIFGRQIDGSLEIPVGSFYSVMIFLFLTFDGQQSAI